MWLRLLIALVFLPVLVVPGSGRGVEALRVLVDLADGPGPTLSQSVSPPPTRETLPYAPGLAADFYTPAAPTGAGLVLVPGLTPQSKDDPRLVEFARTLARARITVLVPDLSGRRSLHVGSRDVPEVAAAAVFLSRRLGRPVGLAAISYAVGPAMLAAASEAARDRIGWVLAIGGYYDMTAVLTYITTGHYRAGPDRPWTHRPPQGLALWLLVRAQLGALHSLHDRAVLHRMAERRLENPAAPLDDLAPHLGPEGRAVLDLMTNADPDRVPALRAALPAGVAAELDRLDLSRRDWSEFPSRLILVHGRNDPVIPFTQSVALAHAVPARQRSLHVIEGVSHTEVGNLNLSDAYDLWSIVIEVLSARDGITGSGG